MRRGRRLLDSRQLELAVSPGDAFAPIRRIGGGTGWYAFDWLWRLRGFIDLLIGGVGVRRGRPDPEKLHIGDTVDWWRVEAYQTDQLLRLRAEMRLPGRAWLERAPWLDDFRYEMLAFPYGHHDDQAYSVFQFPDWAERSQFAPFPRFFLYSTRGMRVFSGVPA